MVHLIGGRCDRGIQGLKLWPFADTIKSPIRTSRLNGLFGAIRTTYIPYLLGCDWADIPR